MVFVNASIIDVVWFCHHETIKVMEKNGIPFKNTFFSY